MKRVGIGASLLISAALLAAACGDGALGPGGDPGEAARGGSTPAGTPAAAGARPNILLIVADDLGYTDLGAFGGEINTPYLDALAHSGMMLTNFHAAPTCSPTRAMLLSGTDNHIAGLGNMSEELAPNQKGKPGYEGYLNFRVVSLAELLHDAGYHTYMTGKWHLGLDAEHGPAARGFEKSYALLQGGAGHFDRLALVGPEPALYRNNGKPVEQLPEGFYSTRFYVQRLIDYIESGRGDGKPFFAYLAFSAPHWPLQAPDASIARYRGRYDAGYEVLHARRLARLEELGLVAADADSAPRLAGEPAWEDLSEEQKRIEARKMEIYAAMVDDIDVYTGRLIEYLKGIEQLENTFIFFMSDNGAEGHHLDRGWPPLAKWVEACCDNSYANMGRANSYVWYGPNWARAGVGPWRRFKGFTSEGGVRVPAFVRFPSLVKVGQVNQGFASVMDVMPTLLDVAGVEHPGRGYHGHPIEPMQGVSLLAMLRGDASAAHPPDYVMGWELFGKRGLRRGNWKLIFEPLPHWSGEWQLYDLAADPAEQHDLAADEPDRLADMVARWQQYAATNGVIIPEKTSGY